MAEKTLAIIKPDAVRARHVGKIIDMIEGHSFIIRGLKMITLTKAEAQAFYAVHKERSFFSELVMFMSSGPIVVMALEKEQAVAEWRKLMGDTNPEKALPGTVRKRFGSNIGENATHGSDSLENAATEVAFFFNG